MATEVKPSHRLCCPARTTYGAVVRLIWLGSHPGFSFSRLPYGWSHNRFPSPVIIACRERLAEIRKVLDHLFWGQPEEFVKWVKATTTSGLPVFELGQPATF